LIKGRIIVLVAIGIVGIQIVILVVVIVIVIVVVVATLLTFYSAGFRYDFFDLEFVIGI
jgi:hypothetical protein